MELEINWEKFVILVQEENYNDSVSTNEPRLMNPERADHCLALQSRLEG